jgi:hypothetical protein
MNTPSTQVKFARFLVRAHEKRAHHVDQHAENHQRRAPRVQAADQPAEMRLGHDEAHALERRVGGRPVIDHQQNAGDHLVEKQKQRQAAERVPETDVAPATACALVVAKFSTTPTS